jgi:hypothetical protein
VLDTIKIDELVIPARILDLIPPRAFGYGGRPVELFEKRTDLVFDPIGAATIAADLAVSALLQLERAARLNEFHSRNESNPAFDDVVRALLRQTWYYPAGERPKDARGVAVLQAVQDLVATRLMDLASNPDAAESVRTVATGRLRNLRDQITSRTAGAPAGGGMPADHLHATVENIDRFLSRPDSPYKRTAPLAVPPGDPIGGKIR